MANFCILRLIHHKINQEAFHETCEELQTTRYEHLARLEAAPQKTDCLTAIHYLVKKVMNIDLHLDRIGNMPRILTSSEWKWTVIDVTSEEQLQPGDLLFLRLKMHSRLITHLAILLNSKFVFHSSQEKEGGSIEPLSHLLIRYDPLRNGAEMLAYEDPRRSITPHRHRPYSLSKEFITPQRAKKFSLAPKGVCQPKALYPQAAKRTLGFELDNVSALAHPLLEMPASPACSCAIDQQCMVDAG